MFSIAGFPFPFVEGHSTINNTIKTPIDLHEQRYFHKFLDWSLH